MHFCWAFQVVLVVKNTPANAGNIRDVDSIPGSGRSLKEELATCASCLQNPMGRGAWQAMVHRVTKSWKQLQRLSMHARTVDL